MLIEHKEALVLLNSSFKQSKKILYDDYVISDFYNFNVNDFNKISSDLFCLSTSFKDYYYEVKDKILIKDFLTNEIVSQNVSDIYLEDKLIIKKRTHNFLKNNIRFIDSLYLGKYDYSTSLSEIILKYNLPKKFLVRALTTGCPDDEYPEAKEYNLKLQRILNSTNSTIEDLKKNIVDKYTHVTNKQHLKINYKFLDLIYLSIMGDYELLTNTSLKLKIKDKKIFESIIKLLIDLNINKTVYNDFYNSESCSVILINSSLIYNLFESNFNNYNFILNMSKSFSNYLFYKLMDQKSFHCLNIESLSYLQEFLFRYFLIFKKEIMEDNLYLVVTNDYTMTNDSFIFNVTDIKEVNNANDYLRIS